MAVYAKGFVRILTERFDGSMKGVLSKKDIIEGYAKLIMHPGRNVEFIVLKPDGQPLTEAVVVVGGKDWAYGRGRTDERGKVSIADLPTDDDLRKGLSRGLWGTSTFGKFHVTIQHKDPWRQKGFWLTPNSENKIVIRMQNEID